MLFMNAVLYREYYLFHAHVQKVFFLQQTYQHYLGEMLSQHLILAEQLDVCQTDVVLTTASEEVAGNDVQLVTLSDTVQEEAQTRSIKVMKSEQHAPLHTMQQRKKNEINISWPLERSSFWISSYFGPRKKPGGGTKFHYGIDMAALKGTPVYAAAGGDIIEADYARGYGNTIVVKHSATYQTRYAHLHKILVEVGKKVKKGDCIGQVGDTGSVRKSGSDASHLHFEVYAAGKKVNPMRYLS